MNVTPWADMTSDWPGVTVSDDAQVGQAVGVHNGDTAIHSDTTYNINQDDPPERKEEVAFKHLDGGTPRPAEGLLRDVLHAGNGTGRRAYLYALALFSERSLAEVDEAVFDEFDLARKIAARCSKVDDSHDALDVVCELVRHAWEQDLRNTGETGGIEQIQERFDALPVERRDDITRHLDLVLDGAVQERLSSAETRRVLNERMLPDRKGRAWKFFEPEPASPRRLVPSRTVIATPIWMRAVLGMIGVLFGLYLSLGHFDLPAVWLSMMLLAFGGYLVWRHDVDRRALAMRYRRAEHETDDQVPDGAPPSPGHWVKREFVEVIHQRVNAGFRAVRLHIAGQWKAQTRGVRRNLTKRLAMLYGNTTVEPEALDWLIRWHGERCAERWRGGDLFAYRSTLLPAKRTILLLRLGITSVVAGLITMATSGAVIPALVLGVCGCVGAIHGSTIVAARLDDRARQEENLALLKEELQAFDEWRQVLEDRPSDDEMGRWLNLDKIYLATAAARHGRLTERDLADHFVTLEKTPQARQAAVPDGPPRYSAYVVKVFLLTRNGVRIIESELNFLNGARRNEQRSSFRYESLASAGVSEKGIRVAHGNRYAVQDENKPDSLEVVRLRSRALRLVLVSGSDITVITNKFDRIRDMTDEEESYLRQRELDAAGIPTALRTLESVASEGKHWMQREQERRMRLQWKWKHGDSADAARAVEPEAPSLSR